MDTREQSDNCLTVLIRLFRDFIHKKVVHCFIFNKFVLVLPFLKSLLHHDISDV